MTDDIDVMRELIEAQRNEIERLRAYANHERSICGLATRSGADDIPFDIIERLLSWASAQTNHPELIREAAAEIERLRELLRRCVPHISDTEFRMKP